MKKLLEPGKYVVAVSGGIDSVALLHMLVQDKELQLAVAHFDHGIRPESTEDAGFVEDLAHKYRLPIHSKREELGGKASEALARERRYKFLEEVLQKSGSKAIVTAHHQDDLIETALLNVLRGTKRRGLVSLQSTARIKRPLLGMTKREILDYAKENKLQWREDSTNQLLNYRRNQIRQLMKNSLTPSIRRKVVSLLEEIKSQNKEIEEAVETFLVNNMIDFSDFSDKKKNLGDKNLGDKFEDCETVSLDKLNKKKLNSLGLAEAYEIVAAWLRMNKVSFDEPAIKRLVIGARTLQNGAQIDISGGCYCQLTRDQVVLKRR